MAGFMLYVFFVGLIGESDEVESVLVDISGIKPGDVKLYRVGKRKLLVLHRSTEQIALLNNVGRQNNVIYRSVRPQYFLAWAYDPFFGCDLEYLQNSFKAICVSNYYDLAGRLLNGDASARELIVPDYRFEDDYRISVKVDD